MTKRIDLTQFEGISKGPWRRTSYFSSWRIHWFDKELSDDWESVRDFGEEYRHEDFCYDVGVVASSEADARLMAAGPELLAELKKMYAREDELLDALRIIRDDLNEGMAQGHLPIESTHGVSARKIRNFANDASQ